MKRSKFGSIEVCFTGILNEHDQCRKRAGKKAREEAKAKIAEEEKVEAEKAEAEKAQEEKTEEKKPQETVAESDIENKKG